MGVEGLQSKVRITQLFGEASNVVRQNVWINLQPNNSPGIVTTEHLPMDRTYVSIAYQYDVSC